MNVPSLTGVRGIAALWVVFFHLQMFPVTFDIHPLSGLPVLRSGWAGVDLFFVLSGFILMLVHETDFQRLAWPKVFRFAWLRFFRVYPLATAVLLLICALALADQVFAHAYQTSAYPRNFTFPAFLRTITLSTRWWLPTDGDFNQPEWSLSAEIVGYAAFPLLAFLATKITNRWVLAILAAACLFYPTLNAFQHGTRVADDLFWGALPRMAGGFTGGILLCRLHRLTPESFRPWQGGIGDFGMLALLVVLVSPAPAVNATTLCFGLIIYGIASGRGFADRLFSTPLAVWLGRISFPLYLIHVMPMTWLRFNIANYALPPGFPHFSLLLYVVFIFALSWLLHIAVERPAHRFAREALPAVPQQPAIGALAGQGPNR